MARYPSTTAIKCENCGHIFPDTHGECPKCGCAECYELEPDEEPDIYEVFDRPDSPIDTIGGI